MVFYVFQMHQASHCAYFQPLHQGLRLHLEVVWDNAITSETKLLPTQVLKAHRNLEFWEVTTSFLHTWCVRFFAEVGILSHVDAYVIIYEYKY